MSGAPPLTVAIATYNGRELLARALASLDAQRFRDFEILVVDDASSDGTADWLRAERPGVRLVAHLVNRGVTAALNTGLRESRSELTMLLNNDMELEPGCLGALVASLESHREAGSACPKLLAVDQPGHLDGAGDTFHWAGLGWRRGHGEQDRGQYDRAQPVFGACGGAAVYTRAALDAVGGLDEDFFAFYEDVDWALRARLAGFGCRYEPAAVAHHIGSATLGKGATDFTRYQTWRNSLWLIAKDYPAPLLLKHLPRIAVHQLSLLALALRERKLGVLLRAWRDALAGLPAVLRKRSAVQATRRVSVRELERIVREER